MCVAAGLFIQNASGIQIGSNNTLSIRGHESYNSLTSSLSNGANSLSLLKENLQMYGKSRLHPAKTSLLPENRHQLPISLCHVFY